jgi:hypothetical protein
MEDKDDEDINEDEDEDEDEDENNGEDEVEDELLSFSLIFNKLLFSIIIVSSSLGLLFLVYYNSFFE